jgi:hypothetical protein
MTEEDPPSKNQHHGCPDAANNTTATAATATVRKTTPTTTIMGTSGTIGRMHKNMLGITTTRTTGSNNNGERITVGSGTTTRDHDSPQNGGRTKTANYGDEANRDAYTEYPRQ